jgi:hypothetical protein
LAGTAAAVAAAKQMVSENTPEKAAEKINTLFKTKNGEEKNKLLEILGKVELTDKDDDKKFISGIIEELKVNGEHLSPVLPEGIKNYLIFILYF